MENHNGVIGRYPGATGMKTGFICASGFNVVATARRDGRELVAVVFGQPNAAERTFRTIQLFDDGFARRASGPTLESLPVSTETEAPNMREAICGRKGAPAGESSEPAAAASPGEGAVNDPAAVAGPRRLGQREPFEPIVVAISGTPAVAAKPSAPASKGGTATAAGAEKKTPSSAEPAKKPVAKTASPSKKDEPKVAGKSDAPVAAKKPAPRPAPPKPSEGRPAPSGETVAGAKPEAEKTAATETKEAATLGATPILPSGGILNLPARSPALSDRSR